MDGGRFADGEPLFVVVSPATHTITFVSTDGDVQFSHLHPYMTSDNPWLVFNSNRIGERSPQVLFPQHYLDS